MNLCVQRSSHECCSDQLGFERSARAMHHTVQTLPLRCAVGLLLAHAQLPQVMPRMWSTSAFPVDHEVIAIVFVGTSAPTHLYKAHDVNTKLLGPFLLLLHQFRSPPLENVAASCGGSTHHRQHPQWARHTIATPRTSAVHHVATRISVDESCPELLCNGE